MSSSNINNNNTRTDELTVEPFSSLTTTNSPAINPINSYYEFKSFTIDESVVEKKLAGK